MRGQSPRCDLELTLNCLVVDTEAAVGDAAVGLEVDAHVATTRRHVERVRAAPRANTLIAGCSEFQTEKQTCQKQKFTT